MPNQEEEVPTTPECDPETNFTLRIEAGKVIPRIAEREATQKSLRCTRQLTAM